MLTNRGQPVIVVEDGNFENRSELLLRHVHEGTDLDGSQARDTLRNAAKLWTRPVCLLTKVDGKGKLLRCEDGNISRAQRGVRLSTLRLWAWGQSDPGRKRERNEDSYLVDPETGILAVADGMGGHQGGATASADGGRAAREGARRGARRLRRGASQAARSSQCATPRRCRRSTTPSR